MNPLRLISLVQMTLNGVMSRLFRAGTLVMEEKFALMMAMSMLVLMNQFWCKPPRDCLLQHSPLPSRLLSIGLLTSHIGRGADSASLPSGGTLLTYDYLTIQERYRCLLLTIASLEMLVTKMLLRSSLEDFTPPEL